MNLHKMQIMTIKEQMKYNNINDKPPDVKHIDMNDIMGTNEVSILGTRYRIEVKEFTPQSIFSKQNCYGLCNNYTKIIFLCDLTTHPDYDYYDHASKLIIAKKIARHEILHAYFYEAGMTYDTCPAPWHTNEECVEWFAINSPKIFRTFNRLHLI